MEFEGRARATRTRPELPCPRLRLLIAIHKWLACVEASSRVICGKGTWTFVRPNQKTRYIYGTYPELPIL